jgi:hypothetical protein
MTGRFESFSDLSRAIHAEDVKRAKNLNRTRAARQANRARKQADRVKALDR